MLLTAVHYRPTGLAVHPRGYTTLRPLAGAADTYEGASRRSQIVDELGQGVAVVPPGQAGAFCALLLPPLRVARSTGRHGSDPTLPDGQSPARLAADRWSLNQSNLNQSNL